MTKEIVRRTRSHPPCIPQNTRPNGKNERKRLLSPRHQNPPILTPFSPTTRLLISPYLHNSTPSAERDNTIASSDVSDKERELVLVTGGPVHQWTRSARTWAHPFTPLTSILVGVDYQYCGSETGDAESVYVCPLPLIPRPPHNLLSSLDNTEASLPLYSRSDFPL